MAFTWRKKKELPEGLWRKCDGCQATIYNKELEDNLMVCSECGWHYPMHAMDRITSLLDGGLFEEYYANMQSGDPLNFVDRMPYTKRVEDAKRITGLKEGFVIGRGEIQGRRVFVGACDTRFIMGSMASVMGEKIARATEEATKDCTPLVIITATGGARMQEGTLSLMQMVKTSAGMARFHEAGGLFISVLANPTTGGVLASYASQGDIILAEPRAVIGFAGARVIKQTLKIDLPKGFQTAEFLLEHGMIDRIVPRGKLRDELAALIKYLLPVA